jgi:ribosomal protein S18 acetylase RimI-like enzyme
MMRIRRWEPSDADAVFELHVRSMKESDSYKGEGPWDDDMKDVDGVYFANGGEFLVGEEDGAIIAMGAYKRTGAQDGEIKRIRTHPDHQRRGCARAIMDELERRAIAAGITKLELVTTVTQTAAQRLYAKCGFAEVGRERIMGYDCILYAKTLTGKTLTGKSEDPR